MMAMPDSQRYPNKLCLINNVEEMLFFLGLKVFDSKNYYMLSCSRNAQVTVENPEMKILIFVNYRH